MNQEDLFGQEGSLEQRRISLAGNAELLYLKKWLNGEEADRYLEVLKRELAWAQPEIKVYGKRHRIPRLQSWYGDQDTVMTYSGASFVANTWHPILYILKEKLELQCGVQFNSVLANLYRDGQDAMGWHADDEKELGTAPIIASVSLGAARIFNLRPKKIGRIPPTLGIASPEPFKLSLSHGDLIVMAGETQRYWEHSIPKTAKISTPRINLTYRYVLPARKG